jgi:CheY-like chemotaxis protein
VSGTTAATLIMIVEDNEQNLKLVRDLLQYNGYETIEARNAEDGVALAAERRPDLILMDIQLPDADGVTALGRLRADGRTASIGVVALTAFAMTDDRQRLLQAGFDGYLEKPIDVRAFPGQVLALLQSTRPESI